MDELLRLLHALPTSATLLDAAQLLERFNAGRQQPIKFHDAMVALIKSRR